MPQQWGDDHTARPTRQQRAPACHRGLRAYMGWHRFGSWSTPNVPDGLRSPSYREWPTQERVCLDCNFVETRWIEPPRAPAPGSRG